jgi:uncharacterized protein (DUF1697 family)
MEYVALLRGINVGGNAIIKMADLKKSVEQTGFNNVRTYIQSGNLVFESGDKNLQELTRKLEETLRKAFNYDSWVYLKTGGEYRKSVAAVPDEWKQTDDLRCYIAFLRDGIPVGDVLGQVELKDDIDFVEGGDGVIYMSTRLSGITKSRLTRLITKKVYKDITLRNYNTARKLLALLDGA